MATDSIREEPWHCNVLTHREQRCIHSPRRGCTSNKSRYQASFLRANSHFILRRTRLRRSRNAEADSQSDQNVKAGERIGPGLNVRVSPT